MMTDNNIKQPVKKSSNEILTELFGAFDAEPPPLVINSVPSDVPTLTIVEKGQKKHKKSKKHHKKPKKRKESHESNNGENDKKAEEVNCKKHKKKHKHKVKKRKSGESQDDDTPIKKKHKLQHNKNIVINISDSDLSDIASENVNKVKQKVIESLDQIITNTTSKINTSGKVISSDKTPNLIIDTVKIINENVESKLNSAKKPSISSGPVLDIIKISVKSEPIKTDGNKFKCTGNVRQVTVESKANVSVKHEETVVPAVTINESVIEAVPLKHTLDPLVEDCFQTEVKLNTTAPEKKRFQFGNKITIKNLKNSTVFEETVRQVEEQARLKAERYEEGELSDSGNESDSSSTSEAVEPQEGLTSSSIVPDITKEVEISISDSKGKVKSSTRPHRRSRDSKKRSSRSKDRRIKHRSRSKEKHKSSKHKKRSKSPPADCSRKQLRSRSHSIEKREHVKDTGKRKSSRDRDKHNTHHGSKRKRSSSQDRWQHHSRGYSRRSKSRSRSRSNSRSRSYSKDRRHDGQEKIDKRRLLEIARKNALSMLNQKNASTTTGNASNAEQNKVSIAAGGKTVDELTDFCKLLSRKDAEGHESISSNTSNSEDSESEKPFHHPFQLKDRPQSIVMNIRNSVAVPLKTFQEKTAEQSKALRLQFPVSSGQLHRKKESDWVPVSPKLDQANSEHPQSPGSLSNVPLPPEPPLPSVMSYPSQQLLPQLNVPSIVPPLQPPPLPPCPPSQPAPPLPPFPPAPSEQVLTGNMSINALQMFEGKLQECDHSVDITSAVTHRLSAMKRLQEDPNDVEAIAEMNEAQKQAQAWVQSKFEPGHFTGSTGARVLTQAELASGLQAWARKDQFNVTTPVRSGMGMALLQKMGWRPGEGLGKNKEGSLEPLKLQVKMDKRGLVASGELSGHGGAKIMSKGSSFDGKHPVSLLNEICSRKRFGPPMFDCCFETGPDHKKNFIFKVTVNGVEYKPSIASQNKKQAKVEAATVCLRSLGLIT